MMNKPVVNIAIALLLSKNKILVGWRNSTQHQGNKYEFPGGKIEQGESAVEACRREVIEEVGVDISQWHAKTVIQHEYEDIFVNLHFFQGFISDEQLKAAKHPWTLYERTELADLNFPKANQRIISQLIWPKYIKISAELKPLHELDREKFLYFRPQLNLSEYSHQTLERSIVQIESCSAEHLNQLIINIDIWSKLNADTQKLVTKVHLRHDQLLSMSSNSLVTTHIFIASCHDIETLQHAQHIGCDAVFLSPVQDTRTHPNAEVLGWKRFQELAQHLDIPVFALGGLNPTDLELAINHGAYGLAGIRHF